jgi:hypothetical protein
MILDKKEYNTLLELDLVNFKPWRILSIEESDDYTKDLKKRYSKRLLIPFAIRTDCDDVACWDMSKENIEMIYVIHDFASEGWEQQEEYKNFKEWFNSAIEDMFTFE